MTSGRFVLSAPGSGAAPGGVFAGEAAGHEVDHGDVDHGFGAVGECFLQFPTELEAARQAQGGRFHSAGGLVDSGGVCGAGTCLKAFETPGMLFALAITGL